jgi:hypothetical protein
VEKWKALAAEKGCNAKCPWCWRYVALEIPKGTILTACNDCRGEIKMTAGGPENDPWPAKGSVEYSEFVQDKVAEYDSRLKASGPSEPFIKSLGRLGDDDPTMKGRE